MAVEFEGQSHQRLGPAAVLFGLMQIARHFQRDRNLRRQSPGTTNVLLRDAGLIDPVEHAEHSQNFALGIEQRDRQQLPYVELGQDFQVRAGDFAGLVRPENLLVEEGPAGGSGRKQEIHLLLLAVFCRPAHVEGAVFKQPDEAASEAEEIRGAQRKLLQELIQLADRAELG